MIYFVSGTVNAPHGFPLLAATQPVRLTRVFSYAKEWLNL